MDRLIDIGLTNAAFATVLAILAFMVDRVAKRPAISHLLWMLVLAKLITPPLIGFQVPVPERFLAMISPEAEAECESPDQDVIPFLNKSLLVQASRLNRTNDRGIAVLACETTDDDAEILEDLAFMEEDAFVLPDIENDEISEEKKSTANFASIRWRSVVMVFWLVGTVAWFITAAVRIAQFRRVLSHAEPAEASVQMDAKRLALALGLHRCPSVWMVPVRVSPLLWAMGGPARLVVPKVLMERLGAKERSTLLTHELCICGGVIT